MKAELVVVAAAAAVVVVVPERSRGLLWTDAYAIAEDDVKGLCIAVGYVL